MLKEQKCTFQLRIHETASNVPFEWWKQSKDCKLTPVRHYLLGTSCHTSPTENYSEIALPDSRITEKTALPSPGFLYFASSFPSPFLGLFYRLLSWCQGFHCNTVNFFAPASKPRSSCTSTAPRLPLQGGSTKKPRTHSWLHQGQVLHT